MKYIITDNIRVAKVTRDGGILKKRPLDYLGTSIWIKGPSVMQTATVTSVTWAGQGVAVLTVMELGEYNSPLQKAVLKVATQTKPKRIAAVKIYWRGDK